MVGLKILDVVALRDDVPSAGLVAGQVGTIVETLRPGTFEVEFSDSEGRTYALLALDQTQLLALHYEPAAPA